MKRLSPDYVDYLETIIFSLLAEREDKHGKGDLDEFEEFDLDRGPNDKPITYTPLKVTSLIAKTYKEFVENGWK